MCPTSGTNNNEALLDIFYYDFINISKKIQLHSLLTSDLTFTSSVWIVLMYDCEISDYFY